MNDQTRQAGNSAELFIGTAGYSYPDWKNVFYPSTLPANRYLEHYTKFFNALEVNFTFYRMPSSRSIRNLTSMDYQELHLSFKAHQSLTHQSMEIPLLKEFLAGLEPLSDQNRVKTLLFQFPYSFQPCNEAWDRLSEIAHYVCGVVPVVEFRHSSWFTADTLGRLSGMGLAICAVDMPGTDDLPGVRLPVTHPVGYMRFHGRNQARWWKHEQAWQRYDYLYSERQLEGMLPELRTWMERHRTVYFYFNNHYRGQAVQNAQLLMAFLAD